MGVYIKDLKKPKGCYECPIAKSYLDCLMEKKYVCPIGHTDDCPLIELDDEMINKFAEVYLEREAEDGNIHT